MNSFDPPRQPPRSSRRLASRTPAVVPVTYRSNTLSFRGVSVDISPYGALVLTPLADAVGTHAKLELELTTGDSILQLACRVVRVNRGASPGLGVVFEELDASERRLLERYCSAGS